MDEGNKASSNCVSFLRMSLLHEALEEYDHFLPWISISYSSDRFSSHRQTHVLRAVFDTYTISLHSNMTRFECQRL